MTEGDRKNSPWWKSMGFAAMIVLPIATVLFFLLVPLFFPPNHPPQYDSYARAALAALAAAQEEYFAEHETYASDAATLPDRPLPPRGVSLTIIVADRDIWVGAAKHEQGRAVFIYDSHSGRMTAIR